MWLFYDLIFFLIALIYLPIYILRKKAHRGFLSRLGFWPVDNKLKQPIWVHAVSVGEAMVVKGLIEELRKVFLGKNFVISTITPTGNKIAQGIVREGDFLTYLPLDFSFIVRKAINKIRPSLFIIAETEIWPNLIYYLHKKGIPVVVINGRISDSSFRGYLSIRFLIRPILNKVSMFCVQSDTDAQRLQGLGVLQHKIHVTGNMKFDSLDYAHIKSTDCAEYKIKLGLEKGERLFLAGSTHPGEEDIVLKVYQSLLKERPGLRLLIAPRHPERTPDIEKMISCAQFEAVRISRLDEKIRPPNAKSAVFILDTIGQLRFLYSLADVVFVGGSLIKKGGQNILEPAFLGKPVLFGPYMFNFRDISELFLKNQAAVLVHNAHELKEQVKYLLDYPEEGARLAQRAKEIILNNQGATQRNLKYIEGIANSVTA